MKLFWLNGALNLLADNEKDQAGLEALYDGMMNITTPSTQPNLGNNQAIKTDPKPD